MCVSVCACARACMHAYFLPLLTIDQIFLLLQGSCFVLLAQHVVSDDSVCALALQPSELEHSANVVKAELGLQCSPR